MITACRACGASELLPVLDLGQQPLANALRDPTRVDAPEPRFPLSVAFCSQCTLLQVLETVPPERLFSDYPYFSSNSVTMVEHARTLVAQLIARRSLDGRHRVVEIASNDGYLLQWYVGRGISALGIEPAANVAIAARGRGVPTKTAFFGADLAREIVASDGTVDVVHAHNVLAHVPDLNGFVEGLRILLGTDGIAVIEVPYVRPLIQDVEFDTIYHEHLSYFSVTALARLFARNDLAIADVERLTIHGGSLRLFVGAARSGMPSVAVDQLLEEERALGMTGYAYYRDFGARVREVGVKLRELLASLRTDGHRIAAYGAAAKGATLLNHFHIGRETLDFVVDRSPHKQGRLMPGVGLPIFDTERLLGEQPAYTLLLTWNFKSEILEQQTEYRRRGGRFIVPLPEPTVLQ